MYNQFIAMHDSLVWADAEINLKEKAILLITENKNNVYSLSQEKYNDEVKLNSFIESLLRNDLSRFFKS